MTMLVEGLILGTTTKVASRSNTAPPAEPLPLSLRSFRQEHIIVSGEVVMCQLKGLCRQHFQADSDTSMLLPVSMLLSRSF